MKQCKIRWLFLLTALAIMLSALSVTVFAEPESEDTYAITITPSTATAVVGETISFTAEVFKNGQKLENMESNQAIYFWTDVWNEHSDGSEINEFINDDADDFTTKAVMPAVGTYYIAAEYKENDVRKAIAYATVTVLPEKDGYAITITPDKTTAVVGDVVSFTTQVWKDGQELESIEDNHTLYFWTDVWNEHSDGSVINEFKDDDNNDFTTKATMPAIGTYYVIAEYKAGEERVAMDCAVITVEAEEDNTDIFVEKVSLGEDFIWGADVSSLLANLKAGARYKDFDGTTLGSTVEEQGQGFMELLKDVGYNWVRLRVWNDPYDSKGKGYGGGNNDIDAAVTMGKWATDAGLKVLIDFHYSDFWADPGKQWAPKAWRDLPFAELKTALRDYTKTSLEKLSKADVNVGMVQVGNETNGKMCGQDWKEAIELFKVGSAAVRETAPDALVALHFANPHSEGRYAGYARELDEANVDYDVFASSYYPADSAQCTPEVLTNVLQEVADTYSKKVMIAETSSRWKDREWEPENAPYWYNIQGQADELVDAAKAINAVGDKGLGVFYWENAWIPVESTDGVSNQDKLDLLYYAGWASPYSQEYSTLNGQGDNGWGDAGGGDSCLFDNSGKPLLTLKLRQLMETGLTAQQRIPMKARTVELGCGVDEALPALPETVTVVYNDRSTQQDTVVWDGDFSSIDNTIVGEYTIHGTAAGLPVTAKLKVSYPNLLENPGFESEDISMYTITNPDFAKRSNEDPYEGNCGLHFFFSGDEVKNFTVEQSVNLTPGDYVFTFWAQGHNNGEKYPDAEIDTYAYVKFGEQTLKANFDLTGWANWTDPKVSFHLTEDTTVTVGSNVISAPGAWGTIDNFTLYKLKSVQ